MRTVERPGTSNAIQQQKGSQAWGSTANGFSLTGSQFAPRARMACAVAVLVVLTVLVAGFSLAVGSRSIPLSEVVLALFSPDQDAFAAKVVQARVPRTLFALLAGAAQGVSGLLMQRVTRNPIADPSILGVNAGASLFVVSAMAFLGITTSSQYIWCAIAGAALTAAFVYGVGSSGRGGASPLKLALAGTAVSTAFSSLVSIIVMPRENVMSTFRFWQVGSVSGASWADVQTFMPFLLVGLAAALVVAPALEVLALGDDAAVGLGAKPGLVRLISSAAAVVLCGATTAIAGPIAFVGLMVPHLVCLLYKGGLRTQMLLTALLGAFVFTAADVIGRVVVSPGELEVGIVTAFVGAPVFIAVAVRTAGGMRAGEVA